MKKFLLASLLLLCGFAHANDASFSGVSGSPKLMSGEHSQIRMRSEKVVLTPRKNGFETRATFDFVNESSRPVTVQMGFPEGNYGADWSDGQSQAKINGFLRFATFVEGRKVPAKRTVVRSKEDGQDVWWIKTVRFAPREQKTVRVETLSPYGGSTEWGFQNCATYHFTGGNWKGKVARSDLEIQIKDPGLWCAVGQIYLNDKPSYFKPTVALGKSGAILRKSWTNWEANASAYVGLWRTVPFWMMEVATNSAIVDEKVLQNVVTFRVGAKPKELPPLELNAPQAFFYNNTAYVSFAHLVRRLDFLAGDKLKVTSTYSASDGNASLNLGFGVLTFRPDETTYPAAFNFGDYSEVYGGPPCVFLTESDGSRSLYVPLRTVAEALKIKTQFNVEKRRFSIGIGDLLKPRKKPVSP